MQRARRKGTGWTSLLERTQCWDTGSIALTDKGPGCVALTVETGLLQFGAWKAKVQLSSCPSSCEGPLSGCLLSVPSVGRDGRRGQGGGSEGKARIGKNERRDRKGERKPARAESYQIRAFLVTSFDPRDPVSRLSCGGQGFSKLTLEGHSVVPAYTSGTPWEINRKRHSSGGRHTSPRIKTTLCFQQP